MTDAIPSPPPPESPRLILASASPRRAALLRAHGYRFAVRKPPFDEPRSLSPRLTPAQQAEALSYFKASSVAACTAEGIILGADTVAAIENRIFGKPTGREDARRILRELAGTTHRVMTGITLLDAATGKRRIEHETTVVTMKPMRESEIEAYLATKAWIGKAGAYGIQDRGDEFVTHLEGSFTNVVGLPMERLGRLLSSWGIVPWPPAHQEEETTHEGHAEVD